MDLASISAGENDMDVDRVACFHDTVHGYSSLLYELSQESGFIDFMCCLKKLWRALDTDENLPKKLVSSAVAQRLTAAALVIGKEISYVHVAQKYCSNYCTYSTDFFIVLPRLLSMTWCSFALSKSLNDGAEERRQMTGNSILFFAAGQLYSKRL